jgi:hypothetical protein
MDLFYFYTAAVIYCFANKTVENIYMARES